MTTKDVESRITELNLQIRKLRLSYGQDEFLAERLATIERMYHAPAEYLAALERAYGEYQRHLDKNDAINAMLKTAPAKGGPLDALNPAPPRATAQPGEAYAASAAEYVALLEQREAMSKAAPPVVQPPTAAATEGVQDVADQEEPKPRKGQPTNAKFCTAQEVAFVAANHPAEGKLMKKKWDGRKDFYPPTKGERKVRGGHAWTYDPADLVQRAVAAQDIRKQDVPRILRDLEIKPGKLRQIKAKA